MNIDLDYVVFITRMYLSVYLCTVKPLVRDTKVRRHSPFAHRPSCADGWVHKLSISICEKLLELERRVVLSLVFEEMLV